MMPIGPIRYEKLNLTELTHLARQIEQSAHRALPREVLIGILEGQEITLPQRLIDGKRLKIMNYIRTNWSAVRYQVTCPAKSQEEHACFGCSDLQVANCTIENSKKFLEE
jgi:hypothetical protein